MKRAILAACTVLTWAAQAQAGHRAPATTVIVNAPVGQIEGTTVSDNVLGFLGIPYAAPPVGNLRWQPPKTPVTFSGVYSALAYGNYCPQGLSEIGPGGGNEDCLYLNVETPANATSSSNLPVMVWIHGGGLTTGSGQEYDGAALVRTGNVVFVSFNYRLGLLGFLAHPALVRTVGSVQTSGNYGLLDQQAAIQWVRTNIAAFGGNPNNITVFGESAGGQSTIDQLISPLTGPIQKAIIESGVYARHYQTQSQAQATGTMIADTLGCTSQTASCLYGLSAQALVAAEGGLGSTSPGVTVAPNIDAYVLTEQPFQAFADGHFQHVPIIDGTNHDEYRLFVAENDVLSRTPYTNSDYVNLVYGLAGSSEGGAILGEYPIGNFPSANYAISAVATDYAFPCGAKLLNTLAAKYTTVYGYEFNDPNVPPIFLPYDKYLPDLGDHHAAELPYLFPAFRNAYLNLGPAQFSVAQQQLAQGMRASWTNLARYGRPINPRGGFWMAYSPASNDVISLKSPSPSMEYTLSTEHNCSFWEPILLNEAGLSANTQY